MTSGWAGRNYGPPSSVSGGGSSAPSTLYNGNEALLTLNWGIVSQWGEYFEDLNFTGTPCQEA